MISRRHYGRIAASIVIATVMTGLAGHLWAEKATPQTLGGTGTQ